MKTLWMIFTINKMVKRNKKSVKRSIFTISEVVVELCTLLAKIIIFPFTLYKACKQYYQRSKKVAPPKNVIDFSEYKKRKKVS